MPKLTELQRRAIDVLGATAQSLVEEIGPHWDGQEDEPVEAKQALLTEWVLMAAWVDPDDGETYRTFVHPPDQPAHHTKGLLWEGLHWNMEP